MFKYGARKVPIRLVAYSQGSLYVTVGKGCSSLGSDCTESNSRVCDGGCDLGVCMSIEEGYYLDEAVVNRPKKRKRVPVGSSQVAANSVHGSVASCSCSHSSSLFLAPFHTARFSLYSTRSNVYGFWSRICPDDQQITRCFTAIGSAPHR